MAESGSPEYCRVEALPMSPGLASAEITYDHQKGAKKTASCCHKSMLALSEQEATIRHAGQGKNRHT